MRILGAVLLLASFTAYGALLSLSLSTRVKKLERLLMYINAVSEEIRISGAELPQVLRRVSHGEEYIENGCWQGLSGLQRREREAAESFLRALGTTDIEGQLRNAELHSGVLSDILREAREEKNRLSRLYVSLFFLGGLFTVVLII